MNKSVLELIPSSVSQKGILERAGEQRRRQAATGGTQGTERAYPKSDVIVKARQLEVVNKLKGVKRKRRPQKSSRKRKGRNGAERNSDKESTTNKYTVNQVGTRTPPSLAKKESHLYQRFVNETLERKRYTT